MTRYVALLRGINVGGKNVIKMADLKSCLEKHGLEDVITYIQSGNVLFSSEGSKSDALCVEIEELLASRFKYKAALVLRTHKHMKDVVKNAPAGFGAEPTERRYDVIFLKDSLTAANAMKGVRIKEGVDEAHAGRGVLYFSRLVSKASQSQLNKLITLPIYQSMTIRNWNTTTTLLRMMDDEKAAP